MKKVVIVFVILSIVLQALIVLMHLPSSSLNAAAITAHSPEGTVEIFIESSGWTFLIHSPKNITYHFPIGSPYILNLNVSATTNQTLSWSYRLEDLKHERVAVSSAGFLPNTTFNAVRWNNRLTVFAEDGAGRTVNKSVEFVVHVNNSAPFFQPMAGQFFACEGNSFFHSVNATDVDEDTVAIDVNPKTPFFILAATRANLTTTRSAVFSGILQKNNVGTYSEMLSVTDGQYTDLKQINITVIEINNAPFVSTVGVQTLYTRGDNATLYKQINVLDIEDGSTPAANFTYNLTFLTGNAFFNVSSRGVINVSANSSMLGIYNVSLCVMDKPLAVRHQNISLCGQNGLSRSTCQNFSITVTDDNRQPTITSYYPRNFTPTANGLETLSFNITAYDPDQTIPDAYWYVDNQLQKYDAGTLSSNFSHIFACGVSGLHRVKAVVTDGLLNDSVEWIMNVQGAACASTPQESGGGGGGGGAVNRCLPQWGCDNWYVCQHAQQSLQGGILAGEDFRTINGVCANQFWGAESCGFQLRNCIDTSACNTTATRPSILQACLYTLNPSCSDGIKNCHDGNCEVLVDCGGSCGACATCSDKIQNQGEEGIDCSGPCPWQCPAEVPFIRSPLFTKLMFVLLLFVLILVIVLAAKVVKVMQLQRQISKEYHA